MSFNKPYGQRYSGRYNNPGQFAATDQLSGGSAQRRIHNAQRLTTPNTNTNTPPSQPSQPPQQFQPPPQQFQPPPQQPTVQPVQENDVEMKPDVTNDVSKNSDEFVRPSWMKSKLTGVKKISNKERRRRQNAHLRRLLSPKNALMALNELLLNEQIPNEFKVEPASSAQFYNQTPNNFCADLNVEGVVYKGYGDTKITARNAAAEQAIRDIMIKKMSKIFNPDGSSGDSVEEEALPMIQLASFALHKLFTEWECDGHKVPQLRPPSLSISETESVSGGENKMEVVEPKQKKKSKLRELPANASSMHPCMLLTYMRPMQEYRELATSGDRPQNMIFTVGVEVDGEVYIGKAANKKEARKAAARAACHALFGVTFLEHNAAATTHATPAATPATPQPATSPTDQ